MVERQRLEFAAEGFLSSMRRIYVSRGGDAEIAIKSLKEYNPNDQSALIKSLEAALKMTGPETDQAFQNWLINRNAQSN